jgi:hypothetical protein
MEDTTLFRRTTRRHLQCVQCVSTLHLTPHGANPGRLTSLGFPLDTPLARADGPSLRRRGRACRVWKGAAYEDLKYPANLITIIPPDTMTCVLTIGPRPTEPGLLT